MALLLAIIGLSNITHATSKNTYGTLRVERVISVYDGDTFRADLSCTTPIVCNNIGIRINGIDTPEMRDKRPDIKKKAKIARWVVKSQLDAAQVIELRNIQRGKYFRVVGDVYVDGRLLADELIERGLAHKYDGGKKKEW